jgi:hypothetical protein
LSSADGTEHSGCAFTDKTAENVDWVKEHVHKNGRIPNHEVVNALGISIGSVQSILKENLYMSWLTVKFVPCLLGGE